VPATVTVAGSSDTGTSSADSLVPGKTVHTVCTGKQSNSDVSNVEPDDVRPGMNAKNVCLLFYMKATSLL